MKEYSMSSLLIAALLATVSLSSCRTVELVPDPYPVATPVIVPDTVLFPIMRAYILNDSLRFDPIVMDGETIKIISPSTDRHEQANVLVRELLYLRTSLTDILALFRQRIEESEQQRSNQ